MIGGGSLVEEALDWATRRLERAALSYGHGTGSAADEAAFLILEGLGLPIDRLEESLDRPLSARDAEKIARLIGQRESTRNPAAYLLGAAYIGRYRFLSDARALVPRSFIGELLVSGMASGEPLPFVPSTDLKFILDLGTGGGSLAILAALAYPEAAVDAVDLSETALELAGSNLRQYELESRVTLFEGSLFGPVAGRRYDLIISNPPYVDALNMAALPPEYRHEPELGLAGGADGLDLVRQIVDHAHQYLSPTGGLICEIGAGQDLLVSNYPQLNFIWLDTEGSEGEVFWIGASELSAWAKART